MNIFSLLFMCFFTYFVPYNRKKLIQNNPINDLGYLLLSSIMIFILTLTYIFIFNKQVSTKINYNDIPLLFYNCIISIIQTLILYQLSSSNQSDLILIWTVMSLVVSVLMSATLGLVTLTLSKFIGLAIIVSGIMLFKS